MSQSKRVRTGVRCAPTPNSRSKNLEIRGYHPSRFLFLRDEIPPDKGKPLSNFSTWDFLLFEFSLREQAQAPLARTPVQLWFLLLERDLVLSIQYLSVLLPKITSQLDASVCDRLNVCSVGRGEGTEKYPRGRMQVRADAEAVVFVAFFGAPQRCACGTHWMCRGRAACACDYPTLEGADMRRRMPPANSTSKEHGWSEQCRRRTRK